MIKGKPLNFLLMFENKEATLEPTSLEKCCSIITHTSPHPHQYDWNNFKRKSTEKQATDNKLKLRSAHLINSRLFYETWRVSGQQTVCGHDVNLIGSSFFQDLCCRDKVSDIIYDVILVAKKFIFLSATTNTGLVHPWKSLLQLSTATPVSLWKLQTANITCRRASHTFSMF